MYNFHYGPQVLQLSVEKSKARRMFGDKLLALKLRCCHWQLTLYLISTGKNINSCASPVASPTILRCLHFCVIDVKGRQLATGNGASCPCQQHDFNMVTKLSSHLTQLKIVMECDYTCTLHIIWFFILFCHIQYICISFHLFIKLCFFHPVKTRPVQENKRYPHWSRLIKTVEQLDIHHLVNQSKDGQHKLMCNISFRQDMSTCTAFLLENVSLVQFSTCTCTTLYIADILIPTDIRWCQQNFISLVHSCTGRSSIENIMQPSIHQKERKKPLPQFCCCTQFQFWIIVCCCHGAWLYMNVKYLKYTFSRVCYSSKKKDKWDKTQPKCCCCALTHTVPILNNSLKFVTVQLYSVCSFLWKLQIV